ncbi:Cof-type HAD-IIB family hydrolase [Halalkalibacter flavus]|uniref:Cof-type HAD-IIB family hydrolase n=1 Tax=Halalkalibacter flavus TaxID=3090668 RepID=UPI002FC5D61F
MVKLIAIDMDGTLLGDAHEVTKENAKAVKEAQQFGVEVVVATGRDEREARYPLKQAQITCPVISVNGAQFRDRNETLLSTIPLLKENSKEIFDMLLTHDIYFELYTNRGTFSDNYEKAIQAVIDFFVSSGSDEDFKTLQTMAKERFEMGSISLVGSYDELLDQEDTVILKVLAFSKDEQKLNEVREKLHEIPNIAVSASAPDNIEITNIQAQKGIAVQAYAKQLGISMNEVMVIGDSFNDVSMFKVAGYKVAMGNAEQAIKDLADFVTKQNDEDGVALAIRRQLNDK